MGKKVFNRYITKTTVDKARETMKEFEKEMDENQEKIKDIKEESKRIYNDFKMEWETFHKPSSSTVQTEITAPSEMKKLSKEVLRNMIKLLQDLESKASSEIVS